MSKYDFKEIDNSGFALWVYAWCNFSHCHVSGLSVDFIPAELFAALLSHPIYELGYDGSDGSMEDTEDSHALFRRKSNFVVSLPSRRHGPFILDRLSPDNFVEITAEDLTERLRARYAYPRYVNPPDPAQIEAIDAYLNRLPKAGMRYFRLAVSHEDPNYHLEGWWTIYTFFDEYILVNPQHQSLWIMVMTED